MLRVGCGWEYRTDVLVTDPWFNPAFMKSWFPWPDTRPYMRRALDANWCYISHAHEDHLDRKFMSDHRNWFTRIIIPKFRSRYLERELRRLGCKNLVVLEHGESYDINPNFRVTMLTDRSHKEDSALLMEQRDTGYRFLDSNDCELAASDWPRDVDLLACQFSGAFWYPHCYEYTPEVRARKVQEVNRNHFERLCRRLALTGAREFLPSAGPPVFLHPDLRQYNLTGIFTDFGDICDELLDRFPELRIHDFRHGNPDVLWRYAYQRKHEWLEWNDYPDDPVTPEEMDNHFTQLQRANSRFLGDYRNDVFLGSGNDNWKVRLGLLSGEFEEEPFNPNYYLEVPPKILRAVIDGKVTWETALLTMRVRLHREPDAYDATLMGLLNFGDRPAQTVAMASARRSTEVIERDGLVIPRYCPHAGEDMSLATICDGVIECPRHNWKWSAETGECLTGQGIDLTVRPSR